MGYCRFTNTLRDLQNCYEHMDAKLGNTECKARQYLIDLCKKIIDEYGETDFEDEGEQ